MDKPNILYIICHDLGRCVNAYGRAPIETPNLDRLAGEGILFTNNFCTSPFCSPSRGAITTGRYPHANGLMGLVNLGWELPDLETTTQEHLRKGGYTSHLFCSQHERSDPHSLGYDTVDVSAPRSEYPDRAGTFLHSAPAEPFYLNYFIFEPHRPFLNEGRGGDSFYSVPDYGQHDDPGDGVWKPPYLPDHEIVRKEMAGFQRLVKTMDDYVGRVLDALDESGLADRTMVVFTTDHGIDMPRAKGTLYDPGIESTLIIRWPRVVPPGEVSDALLSHVDLLPTFLDIAGVGRPDDLHGKSFLPLLRGETYREREEIHAELGDTDLIKAVRTQTHKLIFNVRSHKPHTLPQRRRMDLLNTVPDLVTFRRPLAELYDLEADPNEMHNRWNDSAYADVQADLKRRLIRWMRDTGDSLLDGHVRVPNLVDRI